MVQEKGKRRQIRREVEKAFLGRYGIVCVRGVEELVFVILDNLADEDEDFCGLYLPCLIQIVPQEKAATHQPEEDHILQRTSRN